MILAKNDTLKSRHMGVDRYNLWSSPRVTFQAEPVSTRYLADVGWCWDSDLLLPWSNTLLVSSVYTYTTIPHGRECVRVQDVCLTHTFNSVGGNHEQHRPSSPFASNSSSAPSPIAVAAYRSASWILFHKKKEVTSCILCPSVNRHGGPRPGPPGQEMTWWGTP